MEAKIKGAGRIVVRNTKKKRKKEKKRKIKKEKRNESKEKRENNQRKSALLDVAICLHGWLLLYVDFCHVV